MMRIFLRLPSEWEYLDVEPSCTVDELVSLCGKIYYDSRILYRERDLSSIRGTDTLSSHGIVDGSHVTVWRRLRGGQPVCVEEYPPGECNPSLVQSGWFKDEAGYWYFRRVNGDIYAAQLSDQGDYFVNYDGQTRWKVRGG